MSRRRFLSVTGGAVTAGIMVAGPGGGGGDGVASAAAVKGSAETSRDYVRVVNPWVEADRGRYYFFQSASNPFGFVKLRPDSSTNTLWGTGYLHSENHVKGFSHVHDWQISGVQVMPTTGASVSKTQGDTGWQSDLKHDDGEVAEPGYHRLHLDRYGVTAELTCTDRVGMHRYTYDQAGPSEIIINLGGVLGEAKMKNAQVTKVSDQEIEGFVVQGGMLSDGTYWPDTPPEKKTLFFNIRFDRPFDSLHGWADGTLANGGKPIDKLSGNDMGVYVRYEKLDARAVVQMKVGLSLTGTDGARKNLQTELPGWEFDKVREDSQAHWNEMLGRIDVQGGTQQQQVKFYTDLFHALCGRSAISDVDGRYLDNTWGYGRVKRIPVDDHGVPRFEMYNYDALWLTQWNLNTVLGLAYPEIYSSFVQSQLQMYTDGGLLPRGPSGGNYTFVMTGAPVTSFITGAWNKGIRDFDIDLAYDAMLDAHSIGGLFDKAPYEYASWGGNAGGCRMYLDRGYMPHDLDTTWKSRAAGETLEFSFQDWALGHLAQQLHKRGLNVSQFAEVAVSSQMNDSNFAGARAVDGRPKRSSITPSQNVEWASTEQNPWIKLSWPEEKRVKKVVLSDRSDTGSNVNSGTLTFSDGSSVKVQKIPADGRNKVVAFPAKRVTWVKFQATGGTGENVGLNEIEVWDDTDTGAYLLERSGNWHNLFDRSTGFIRPRGLNGRWLDPFDPLSDNDFVESNSWQATWYTPHDVIGLANRLGGRAAYADKLNHAFEQSVDADFIGAGQNGDAGAYVNYGNQPGLELAHLFNYVGYPWLTQYWVRQVKEKVYGAISTSDGYGHHDEDQGQMGSLSTLMAMGLFEVTGASLQRPVYDITSPIFDEITINLDPDYYPGRQFRIVTHDNSAANTYIQQAKLNGQDLGNAWFYHDQLTDGGTLELWMGDQPNKEWGVRQLPPSLSPEAPAVPYATPDSTRVGSGQSATVKLGAQNLTGKAVTFNWQTDAQGGLRIQPANGSLTVPPNGTATHDVTVEVPEGTAEGVYRARFSATAADGTRLPDAILYVQNAPAVLVSSAPKELRLLQATPATFQVRLNNNDGDHANDAEVSVQAPQGWQVEPATRTVQVPAGGLAVTTFSVTPQPDTLEAATLTLTAQGTWGSASEQLAATVGRKVALVGKIDLTTAEFALSPNHYSNYATTFPNDVDLTVGTSDPATAWSYIHPGPADSWAGSQPHTFTFRFNLSQAPQGDLTFTAWLIDTQQAGPPALALALNGGDATTVQLPAGGGDGFHWGDGSANANIRPASFDFTLPANQLRTGDNTITITTVSGSWYVYDAIGIRQLS